MTDPLCRNAWQIVPDRKISEPSNQAKDEELQENLWKLTVQILKDKLGTLRYST